MYLVLNQISTYYLKQFTYSARHIVKGLTQLKTVQQYAAAEENRSNNNVEVMHAKVQSVHRSSAEAALYLDRLLDLTATACRRKGENVHLVLRFQRK